MKDNNIYYQGQVLWAQLDPNRHLRHSAYADFCAQARSNMLKDAGLSLEEFAKRGIGPILFREELVYHREVGLDETIIVKVELTKLNTVNFRFSFRHEIYKENGIKAATVNVDGAWLNLRERKLTTIPEDWVPIIERIPKSNDYLQTET
ncbi:thioesterase family protein [Sphingobacterium shayense]|uniref:acyl-CoA thioesterase n=1 Tax=Sphingobacterium shayense TaxID=626343 RepID=UPI0015519A41|nr:acyl-CoA thioesterase [Sphingobacterium shayense]NQD72367.1 thioesterase family protein [Sphingobacterium shayense]